MQTLRSERNRVARNMRLRAGEPAPRAILEFPAGHFTALGWLASRQWLCIGHVLLMVGGCQGLRSGLAGDGGAADAVAYAPWKAQGGTPATSRSGRSPRMNLTP